MGRLHYGNLIQAAVHAVWGEWLRMRRRDSPVCRHKIDQKNYRWLVGVGNLAHAQWAIWLLLLACKATILDIEHIVVPSGGSFLLFGPHLFGNAVEALLCGEPGLEIVGRQTDPGQAIRRVRESRPDVVVFSDGEGATGLAGELLRSAREGSHIRTVEVHLATNTVCAYWGEQQSIQEAGDVVHTV